MLFQQPVSPEADSVRPPRGDCASDSWAGVCQMPGLSWQPLAELTFLESLLEMLVSLPAFLLLSFRGTPVKHGGAQGHSQR